MWPAANIAIATGAASGMVVLDIDPLKGGIESLVDLEQSYHPLPDTVMQLTGNGVHYLFAHPGRTTKNGVQTLGAGLDIRGDGGYIIAAPSLHANGKQYAWEICHEPEETPLTPMPDWLIALLQTPATAPIIDVGEPIGEGHRNDTLFRVGSGLRRRGLTEAVILAALREMNTTQCSPPLDDADVVKIVTSIAKYPPGPPRAI